MISFASIRKWGFIFWGLFICLSPLNCTIKQNQTVEKPIFPFSSTYDDRERKQSPKTSTQMTHAEFVSVIFPAFGLDTRTLKTATLEDKIEILENLKFAPAGGYQPDKIFTVKEASAVIKKMMSLEMERAIRMDATQIGQDKELELAVPDTNNPSVLPNELVTGIQTDVTRTKQKRVEARINSEQEPDQNSQTIKKLGVVMSDANNQPTLPSELVENIQSGIIHIKQKQIEAQTPPDDGVTPPDGGVTPPQVLEIEKLLKQELTVVYRPPYILPVSKTD